MPSTAYTSLPDISDLRLQVEHGPDGHGGDLDQLDVHGGWPAGAARLPDLVPELVELLEDDGVRLMGAVQRCMLRLRLLELRGDVTQDLRRGDQSGDFRTLLLRHGGAPPPGARRIRPPAHRRPGAAAPRPAGRRSGTTGRRRLPGWLRRRGRARAP